MNFFSPLSFVAVFGSGIRDPGSGIGKNQDPGSGINIPDPPHCEKGSKGDRYRYCSKFRSSIRLQQETNYVKQHVQIVNWNTSFDSKNRSITVRNYQGISGFTQYINTRAPNHARYRSRAVFWNRDVFIRILIRGSVPLDYGYGYGSGSGFRLRTRIRLWIWIGILLFSSMDFKMLIKIFSLSTISTFASVFKGR
jgi:hypothetical protein